tara:strand:- start:7159 stop:7482 length:324 start_codon:yes stop_codon:yes gene_type:complete
MALAKQIVSLALAVLLLNQQFHMFESVSWSQDNNYSICELDCEQNEHGVGEFDCEICSSNIRSDFILYPIDYSFSDINQCFFDYNLKFSFNNFVLAFASRAPPPALL